MEGVLDEIKGSVPITHYINIYNKILADSAISDTSKYVSPSEKLKLIEFRKSLGDFKSIGGRKVNLRKEFKNLSLILFKGKYEIFSEFALNELNNKYNRLRLKIIEVSI